MIYTMALSSVNRFSVNRFRCYPTEEQKLALSLAVDELPASKVRENQRGEQHWILDKRTQGSLIFVLLIFSFFGISHKMLTQQLLQLERHAQSAGDNVGVGFEIEIAAHINNEYVFAGF